jgi:hypothetical protein
VRVLADKSAVATINRTLRFFELIGSFVSSRSCYQWIFSNKIPDKS